MSGLLLADKKTASTGLQGRERGEAGAGRTPPGPALEFQVFTQGCHTWFGVRHWVYQ